MNLISLMSYINTLSTRANKSLIREPNNNNQIQFSYLTNWLISSAKFIPYKLDTKQTSS